MECVHLVVKGERAAADRKEASRDTGLKGMRNISKRKKVHEGRVRIYVLQRKSTF